MSTELWKGSPRWRIIVPTMIFTLHRYVFRELLRVFILATVGLTLIVSLGGILRPVQEYGIAPRQVVHILTYFMPVSLTFVMPVAALFAAALTYGRFAVDNELDACRASGVSILTLIYPGFVLAILVAIANLLLSFHVMPYFVHLAERSLKADAKQILFHNIQQKGYYALPPHYFLYADYADAENDTLFGIVVVLYENGRVKKTITSEATKVHFDPHDKFNEVQLMISKAKQIGDLANDDWWEVGSLPLKKEFSSLIEDEIKFKKIEEMKQIHANLMLFDPIARAARLAYQQLLTELLAEDIGKVMSAGGVYELAGESRGVKISAKSCALTKQFTIELLAPVVIEERDTRTAQLLRRLRSDKNAVLGMEENVLPARWILGLSDASVEETGQFTFHDCIGDLRLPASLAERLGSDSPLPTALPDRTPALLRGAPSSMLAERQSTLVREINMAQVHILSEIHSRLIFGIGCIPMILIGISLGILQREGHLLSAFGASCVPAAILGVAIISGKQVAENVSMMVMPGILLMWSGLGLLLVLAALTYRRLLRH